MECYSWKVAMCLVALMAAAVAATAQDTPADYVNPHNAAREAAGVAPVKWDPMVAAYARSYAEQRRGDCSLARSGGPYGENLYGGRNSDNATAAADAVKAWTDEKRYYDSATGACAAGKACGRYAQVVWPSSTAIGCARVVCDGNAGGVLVICSYNPPANVAPEDCCF